MTPCGRMRYKKEAPAHTDACSCDTTIFSEKVSRAVADVLAAPGRAAALGFAPRRAGAARPARPQRFVQAPQQAWAARTASLF